MYLNSTMRSCRLCLETADDLVNVFETFQNTTIAAILSKHFWFEVLENDGLPEWLCQICWIQTKTFHYFYKRVELRHGNYRRPIVCRSEIKQERSISPEVQALEPDYVVKHEEVEPPVLLADLITSKEENSDFQDLNACYRNENSETTDDETPDSSLKAKNIERKGSSSLRQSEKDEQDTQIREFSNMKCEICSDVEFKTLFEAKKHYRKVHKTKGYITCCGRKFFFRREIVRHICWHINPDAYRCDQCSKRFKSKQSMENHMKNHDPVESHAFKCSMCPSSFAIAGSLRQHVKFQHTFKTGEKFPCGKCNKKFLKRWNSSFQSSLLLAFHFRRIHEETQEYVCEVCARQFKDKQTLENHVKFMHSTTPPPKLQCNICGAWLKHKVSLRDHLERHQDSKPLNCPICSKEVRNKTYLDRHISYVHGKKRFQCTLCDKAFKSSKSLKEHIAIHTGEDLYNCPYCDKRFKSNANMYNHRKNSHLAEWTRDCPVRSTSTNVAGKTCDE